MSNLLTANYWFSVNPGPLVPNAFNILIGITIFFFVASIVFLFLKKKKSLYRGVFTSLYNLSITGFIIGLVFLFFHYESLPFFTARFWLAIWVIVMAVWFFYIVKKMRKIPKRKEEIEKEKELKKYIP